MNTEIAEIEEACSEEKLLRRAFADCCEALKLYVLSGYHTAPNAITFFENMRNGFDEARRDSQVRRQRLDHRS